MRSGKITFFIFCFSIVYSGCKKEAIRVNAEFEGDDAGTERIKIQGVTYYKVQ